MKKILEAILSAVLLFGSMKAKSEELKQKSAIEQTLEENIFSKINIIFNYKTESEQKGAEYFISESEYSPRGENLWRSSNIPKLSPTEENQVESIMNDIKNKNINSYQGLVEISKNLSENQKLVLLSAVGGSLYGFNYVISKNKVIPQEEFFYKLQNSLESGNQNALGDCANISSHLERLADDIGIRTGAVTGMREEEKTVGHAYDILKIGESYAVIDGYNILITDTKNIEKILNAYQKNVNTIAFQHLFFEDTKFKYRLITKDGKNFLDFVEYDESSQPLKNALINDNLEADLALSINLEDFLKSFRFNYKGFFAKAGEIRGSSFSPMDKMSLFQTGFKRNFLISDISVNPSIGIISGNSSEIDSKAVGIVGDLIVTTNNEKGLNLSSRIAGNIFSASKDYAIFHDLLIGTGASYKIPIKKINIEPYLITQFTFFPKDLGTYNFRPAFNELDGGVVFDIKIPNNINSSIEPYYSKRKWEQEIGGNLGLESKNFGINGSGYLTKSNYEFSPDKKGYNIGLQGKYKRLEMNLNYKNELTDYDGEKENNKSLEIKTSIKF